jgi:Cu-processing system permease protein
MTTTAFRTIAGHELRTVLRGRMIQAFAALFAVLCIGITLAGLGATGQLLVQGFTRTTLSLLTLALYLLPLLGAILGAAAFSREDGGTELLLAQPVGRGEALLGRLLGLAAALLLVATAGFGAAGALVIVRASTNGLGVYLAVAAGAALAGCIGLGIGALIGVLTRGRGAAVGWALAAWFAAAVLYDLACIAVLQVAGNGQPGPWLVALLALNPLDGIRTLGILALGADVLLGPTGAALQRSMGAGGGALWVAASSIVWLGAPLAAATWVFRRQDF